jgi:dUTP pyrophosphatase
MKVYVERLDKDLPLPKYAKLYDVGMDVRSTTDITIRLGETLIVPTGIKVAIPCGYEIQVRPRSGTSLKTPLRIANSPGTIDPGYRDEVGVIITNSWWNIFGWIRSIISKLIKDGNMHDHQGFYHIKKGDRIAQIVLAPVEQIEWEEVDDITTIKGNRGGGFGSTGTK